MFRARAFAIVRALLAVAAFYVLFAAGGVAVDWGHDRLTASMEWWREAGRGLLALAVPPLVTVAVLYGGIVGLLGRSPASVGVPRVGVGVRAVGVGLAWGLGLAAMTVVLCLAGGAELLVRPAPGERYLAVAVPLGAGLALAALLEELLFRGFPLARLAEALGPAAASVLLALVFAGVHAGNPAVSGLGLANVALASLLLSAAFFTPGGLAAALGLHLGWNAGLVFGADAPVSGLRFGLPALEFAPGPNRWWTGGGFGPEGGLAATLVLAAGLGWWVWQSRAKKGEA